MQDRLRDVLGDQRAVTPWTTLSVNDQVATKTDLANLGDELRTDLGDLRS